MKIEEALEAVRNIPSSISIDWYTDDAIHTLSNFVEKVLEENTHPVLNTTLVDVVKELEECKAIIKQLRDKYEPAK